MKKSVLASLLALAIIFPNAVSMVYAEGQAAQSGQITIKDPAEYNAYTNAVGQSTPAAKAAAIEAFLTTYPNSVVKTEMLQTLMLAYQGDMTKMLDAADRLLAADPGNLISKQPRPNKRPRRPMLSRFSTRLLPRLRRVSAPPSRLACRMPTTSS